MQCYSVNPRYFMFCQWHKGHSTLPVQKSGHSVYSSSQLTSFLGHIGEPRPDQLLQPQIIALPPQPCTVGTRHDACITLSISFYRDAPTTLQQGKSGLIRPHDVLSLLQSPVFMHSSKLKPFCRLVSLMNGFLRATHLVRLHHRFSHRILLVSAIS